jgi:mannan endo-1,6-alpha-mannosidase
MNSTLSTFASATYNNTLTDIQCETSETCDNNEIIFKGLTAGWLAITALIVPSTYTTIMPALKISAQSAAEACTGYNNNTCGVRWSIKSWDGWIGLEESMSTTNIFWANLIPYNMTSGPVTSTTGGNSTSNPSAGTEDSTGSADTQKPITAGDRAGAGIITVLFSGSVIAAVYWLITSE